MRRRLRVFAVGGFLSYRALFGWLNPYLFVIILLVPSITQILFFAYLGRAAGVENDTFFVVGNAIVAAAVPGLFGMADTITDERYTHTLSLLVVSPASRLALFLGRAAPVAVNGAVVAAFAFLGGSVILDVSVPTSSLLPLIVTVLVTAFACTGLGIVNAAMGLRWRETALLSNLLLYFLLLAAGVNVPLDLLPGWLSTIAQGIPVTHGVEAARGLVAGESLIDVAPTLGAELLVGLVYATVGLFFVRLFELEARRGASLELA
jgi:ABC-2 type transport system permease protein